MPFIIVLVLNFSSLVFNFPLMDSPQEDRFKYALAIPLEELPPAISQDIEENVAFDDWKITEVYKNQNTQIIPGDFIIKIEKKETFMYLFYTEDGERIIDYQ